MPPATWVSSNPRPRRSMPDNKQFFISRGEAKARGLKTYYVGKRCKNGHQSERWVANSACKACANGELPDEPEAEKKLRTAATGFVWSDEIRQILIDTYVDTGDIEAAREAIQLAPSEYHRELARNQAFKDAIEHASHLAKQTIEERAIHNAAKGNDKIMLAYLKAKFPEQYTDRLKVDQTTTVKLSNEELDRRIARLVPLKQIGQGSIARLARGAAEADGAAEDSDDLSGRGAIQARAL